MKENLFCSPEKLQEICRDYPTPFRLYDAAGIVKSARKIFAAFSWNRNFKDYFTVNICPNPSIIKLLRDEGCGAVCSSSIELFLAEACGLTNEDIIFSTTNPLPEEFKKAGTLGALIDIECTSSRKIVAKVLDGQLPKILGCHYDLNDLSKRGIPENAIDHVFNRSASFYKTYDFGIHVSLLDEALDNETYADIAYQLFRLVVRLSEKNPHISIKYVNFSADADAAYYRISSLDNLHSIAENIHKKYDEILVPAGLDEVAIFTELSNFIIAPYTALITRDHDPSSELLVKSAGTNDYSVGYCYYGNLRPAEILLYSDGSFKEIRRAETLKDYFATVPEVERYFTYRTPSKDFFEN